VGVIGAIDAPEWKPSREKLPAVLIDLHCHTKYSGDNSLDPSELIRAARERGLDAVCITEHDSFFASEPVEKTAEREGFLVFRGVEINTDKGHILAYGVNDDSWRDDNAYYSRITSVRPKVKDCGGILVPAHPFRSFGAGSASGSLVDMNYIAAVEILNGENTKHENAQAAEAWGKLDLPGTGGSDCHFASKVGIFATWFEKSISTLAEMIEEIRRGRVAPVYLAPGGEYKRVIRPGRRGRSG
jgi:predicted metal-dependent phosphoesterase TrpH